MGTSERVTITLPETVVREIDRQAPNRSRFVQEAIRRELARRGRHALRASIENPHAEGAELADVGFDEWASSLPAENAGDLVDGSAGRSVRWVRGRGWTDSGT